MTECQVSQPHVAAPGSRRLELREKFQSALGAPLELSRRNGNGWQCLLDDNSLQLINSATAEQHHRLKQQSSLSRPSAEMLEPGRAMVWIPLAPLVQEEAVLWGMVACYDVALLQRLLDHLWLEVQQGCAHDDLTAQLDVFAEQVTTDFEELCWLRSLTEHLDMCDVQSDEQAVARTILPSLREIVKAETVLLLPLRPPAGEDQILDVDWPAVIFAGERTITDDQCLDLIRAISPAAAEQPAVWNSQDDVRPLGSMIGLRNCMLAKVGKQGHLVGWFLAVNKTPPKSRAIRNSFVTTDHNDSEFGTCEASLFNAAAVMLATHARNVALFREKEKLLVGVVRALINAIDAKDSYTCGHSDRVARIARRLAQEVGLPPAECERVYLAGLLHDIGKIGVPDEVLLKPGGLTEEEFAQIKKHPEIGHSILRHVDQLSDLLPGVLHHHETIDGCGYPHALSGEQIPLLGRILAVADSYDAMTSSRPYRTAMPMDKAEEILHSGAGTQWDEGIVEMFFSAIDDIHAICETEN